MSRCSLSMAGVVLTAMAACAAPTAIQQEPTTGTALSRAGSVPPSSATAAPEHPGRSTAPSVAAAVAGAECNFDWQQPLAQRVAAASMFATLAYGRSLSLSASEVGASNWVGTQADHESGACSAMKAAVVRDAPNTATVRFIQVTAVQAVTVRGRPAGRQPVATVYRVERQPHGGWLVDGISGGD